MAGASSSGPQAISGLSEDIGRFVAWKSSPGGLVQTARGPRGERLTLTHDKCGRVVERRIERDGFRAKVWRYEWDAFDRLIRCVTPDREAWRYGYDPFGRRVWKVKEFTEAEARSYVGKFPDLIDAARLPDRGATLAEHKRSRLDSGKSDEADAPPIVGVHFLWDGDVLAEEAPLRLDGGVDWNKATRWHYEPGTFRPLAKETPDGELLHIVTDHLGTPREMVDEKGDVRWAASYTTWGLVRGLKVAVPRAANDDYAGIGWKPGGGGARTTFGNLALEPIPEDTPQAYACPIRFQGQWQDEETGLYYNRHRHYDPLAGQYLSPDPIGLLGGDRIQAYVGNPNSWFDPLGLTVVARDALGRPTSWRYDATSQDIGTGGATNPMARSYARSIGKATDDAGHARPRNLGGSGTDTINILPQAPSVNRGAFRAFEKRIVQKLQGTNMSADATITPTYSGDSFRPTSLDYMVRFSDGTSMNATFPNP
jgi:RHS repeat-associated protein